MLDYLFGWTGILFIAMTLSRSLTTSSTWIMPGLALRPSRQNQIARTEVGWQREDHCLIWADGDRTVQDHSHDLVTPYRPELWSIDFSTFCKSDSHQALAKAKGGPCKSISLMKPPLNSPFCQSFPIRISRLSNDKGSWFQRPEAYRKIRPSSIIAI